LEHQNEQVSAAMPSIQDRTDTSLARLVQQEVKAQMKRYAMAKTREAFIDSLADELAPGLTHHYRAALALLNGRTDQIDKWRDQEEGFLGQFSIRLARSTKAKGLDKRKAVERACKEVMENDQARKRIETLKFQTSYKLKKVVPLAENAHVEFMTRVWEIVDTMFPP
jgi:hypothetical protein